MDTILAEQNCYQLISSEFDCFAKSGDFNNYIDNAEIITVLNTFDLIQHVHGPIASITTGFMLSMWN